MYVPDTRAPRSVQNRPDPNLLAIGWLSAGHPFPTGYLPETFAEALHVLTALAASIQHPLLGALCALIGVKITARAFLARRLRERHEPEWRQLGSPDPSDITFNPSSEVSKKLWGWVWSRQYRGIDDRAVTIAATCNLVSVTCFIPAALAYFVVVTLTGKLV